MKKRPRWKHAFTLGHLSRLLALHHHGLEARFDSSATKHLVMNTSLLIRYWFPLQEHFGIGVSAYSLGEAREMAERVASQFHWPKPQAVIENVDIRALDQRHVVPNMGPASFHGVWYPALNL